MKEHTLRINIRRVNKVLSFKPTNCRKRKFRRRQDAAERIWSVGESSRCRKVRMRGSRHERRQAEKVKPARGGKSLRSR